MEFGSKIDCPALFQHLAIPDLLAVENGSFSSKCLRHHLTALSLSAGVGGNLVAVQASRISTYLHMSGMPGESSETAPRKCPSPCSTFFSSGTQVGCYIDFCQQQFAAAGWLNFSVTVAGALSQEMVAEVCSEAAVSSWMWLVLWPGLPSRDSQTFSKAAVREDRALLDEENMVQKSHALTV